MKKLELTLDKLDADINIEELKKIIYTVFAIIIMILPVVPEMLNFGFYSFKWTIFVTFTILTSISLLIIHIKEKEFKLNWLYIILIIYLLLVGISTVLTKYDIIKAFLGSNGRGEGFLLILCYALTFVIFSNGYNYVKGALKAGVIAAAIVAVYSILQGMLPVDINLPFEVKRIENVATGTMLNQNFLSSYICIFLPMMTFNYINTGKKTSLAVSILLFLAQVFTVTLGGYITFIAMGILVIVYSLIVSNEKNMVFIRTIVLTTLIVLSFVSVNYIKREAYSKELSGIKTETTNLIEKSDKFGTGRMGIWKKCFMIAVNNKWFGVGPDSIKYEIIKEEYVLKPVDPYRFKIIIDKAHSEPLQIAATTGIPSMVIYLVFVGTICLMLLKICVLGIKNKKEKLNYKNNLYIHMILIGILSYLMQSMINISVVQVAPVYWAMLGLGSGIIYSDKVKE